ncbi:MAG: ABC transporter permease [Planctomycetes bacterium]|nr:ABC transporter permease [Planctomycetota bacterium]
MIRAFSAFLALRYLRSRWINVLGTLGIAVAVWALIVVIAVFSGFIGEIRGSIRNATPDLLCTGLAPGASFAPIDAVLRAEQDVVATAPRLRHHAMYFPHGRGQRMQATRALATNPLAFDAVELVGIDPAAERSVTDLTHWLERAAGAAPEAAPDATREAGVTDLQRPFDVPREIEEQHALRSGASLGPNRLLAASPGILVSRRRMTTSWLERGQQLDVVTGRFERAEFGTQLLRVRRGFAVSGAYDTGHRILDETTAFVGIDELRDVLGFCVDDPFATAPQDVVSDVAIRVRDGADLAAVALRLEAALRRTADQAMAGARVLTWEEQNRVYLGAVGQERAMMKLVLFAVMLVAASLVYGTQHMTVMQKIKDIGILSSMGASPRGVQQVFLLAGLVVGLLGCGLGVAGGLLSVHWLNDVNDWSRRQLGIELFPTELYALDRVPYAIEPVWVAQVAFAALCVAFLAAWFPSRRAARMDPVLALAYE